MIYSSKKIKLKSSLLLSKLDIICSEKKLSKSYSEKNIKIKKNSSNKKWNIQKEKTKIIWSEGGKEVLLTGSFCNWNKFYTMEKDNKEGFFYYVLYLSKGCHQFKFKVDGQWKNSSIYPIFNNQGNLNNYYDNSSINYDNLTISTVESSVASTTLNNNKNIILTNDKNNNIIINNNKNKIDFSYSKKNYCFYYPSKNDLREFPDKKPYYLQTETYHGINKIQQKIGNKNFLNLEDNNTFSGNYSYKNIETKEHVLLNHLCERQKFKNSIIYSSTIRYRHKNFTFIYYK